MSNLISKLCQHTNTQVRANLALAALCISALSACSDSDTLDNINDPELISAVTVAFIHDKTLYEFDRLRNSAVPLIDTELTLYTSIDADASNVSEDFALNNLDYRDAMPEFLVFKNGAKLEAFELETRHVHALYDFASPNNPNGAEQICDLRSVRLPDLDRAKNNKLIVIDERAVYVNAASDCTDPATHQFYKMSIVDSGKTYLIREVTEVNGDLRISTVTKPEFETVKQNTSEALMYEQGLLVDFNKGQFGRYGIDSASSELAFFSRALDPSDNNDQLVWREFGQHFSDDSLSERAQGKNNLFRDLTRQNFSLLNDQVIFNHGDNIVSLKQNSFFEDDATLLRQQAITQAIYQGNNANAGALQWLTSPVQNTLFVLDGQQLVQKPLGDQGELKTDQLGQAEGYTLSARDNQANVLKHFDNGDTSLVTLQSSIESTLLVRSDKTRQLVRQRGAAQTYINEYDSNTSRALSLGANNALRSQTDAFFVNTVDERFYAGHDNGPSYRPALIYGDQTDQKTTYILASQTADLNSDSLIGEQLAQTNQKLLAHADNNLRLINDGYALLKAMVSTEQGPQMKYFYFNPLDKFKERPAPFAPLPMLIEIPLP